MAAHSDLDLAMTRYAHGQDDAFAVIWSELGPRLSRFLRRITNSHDVADDLLQETFLRIHRARGSFVPGSPALAWAYAIARNCHIDHVRTAHVRNKSQQVYDRAGEDIIDDIQDKAGEGDGEQKVLVMEVAQIVDRELRAMTLARREAFVLLRYEGLSVAEAARVLGTTEGAVKVRVHHAHHALHKALARARGEQGEP
jgi:RNA polymerase sigma-70 factor (ECF subfamily)